MNLKTNLCTKTEQTYFTRKCQIGINNSNQFYAISFPQWVEVYMQNLISHQSARIFVVCFFSVEPLTATTYWEPVCDHQPECFSFSCSVCFCAFGFFENSGVQVKCTYTHGNESIWFLYIFRCFCQPFRVFLWCCSAIFPPFAICHIAW